MEGGAAIEAAWSQEWGGGAGQDVLAAALEAAEARCSALDLENARLRLSLVRRVLVAAQSLPHAHKRLIACCQHSVQHGRPQHALGLLHSKGWS